MYKIPTPPITRIHGLLKLATLLAMPATFGMISITAFGQPALWAETDKSTATLQKMDIVQRESVETITTSIVNSFEQLTTSPETATTTETLVRPARRLTTVPLHLSQLIAPQATSEARRKGVERWQTRMRDAFTTEPRAEDEDVWSTAFWAATILEPDDQAREGVRRALRAYSSLDEGFARESLEAAYGVDDTAFITETSMIAEVTTSPKHFAMATLYLSRALPEADSAQRELLARLVRRFPDWQDNPILTMLHFDLERVIQSSDSPPHPDDAVTTSAVPPGYTYDELFDLSVLFSKAFAPGKPVVYSLQRPNRDWTGMAVVRHGDGKFHRHPDGTLFHIAHLARSRTDLPGYITNGNTPQGVFTITGLGRSRSQAIGQTPYLHTMLPIEASAEVYFHDPALQGTTWTLEMYRNLLPSASDVERDGLSWQDYFPLYQAWYAGTAGRTEMLSHGTTVNPEFYAGHSWYPSTPTSGCICAKELWDEATGKAIMSDQLALVHAYIEAAGIPVPKDQPEGVLTFEKGPEGFFVLLELDDEERPVVLEDILMDLVEAERQ